MWNEAVRCTISVREDISERTQSALIRFETYNSDGEISSVGVSIFIWEPVSLYQTYLRYVN